MKRHTNLNALLTAALLCSPLILMTACTDRDDHYNDRDRRRVEVREVHERERVEIRPEERHDDHLDIHLEAH